MTTETALPITAAGRELLADHRAGLIARPIYPLASRLVAVEDEAAGVADQRAERLEALVARCVDWLGNKCRPDAQFVAQGHNWSMNDTEREDGRCLLADGLALLESKK